MKSLYSWNDAYTLYFSSELSLKTVSEKFNISYTALRKRASIEKWALKRNEAQVLAKNAVEVATISEIQKRNVETIKIAQEMQTEAAEAIKKGVLPKTPTEVKNWIETGIRIERLILGMDQRHDVTNKKLPQWKKQPEPVTLEF